MVPVFLLLATTMSQLELNNPTMRIPGTTISLFDRAPLENGRKRGYFRDEATRALLGLNKGDVMQASGTYGAKELAEYRVEFDLLCEGTYDQRFFPFVPRGRGIMRPPQIDLPKSHSQWKPSTRALKNLWENLQSSVADAEKAARLTNLPLPDYAFSLVPRLLYRVTENDPPFEYQFQIWFEPQAHYARWRRIERVASLLDGYVNACHQLLHPGSKEWPCGDPLGIEFEHATAHPKNRDLALAYVFLNIPLTLPSTWAIPVNYSLHDAQAALLSEGRGSATGRLTFDTIFELPGDDHDALDFGQVRPNYSMHRYNSDGSRLTKQQRKDIADEESSDMANDEGSDIEPREDALFPSDKIVEIMDDVQPTGEPTLSPLDSLHFALPAPSTRSHAPSPRRETALTLAPPASASGPASSSTSAPNSAISSASSANAPLRTRSDATPYQDRASRKRQRSSGFPRSSKPPPRSQAGRQDWEQYFESQKARGVSYETSSTADPTRASSSALANRTTGTEVGSARALPQFRVVEMQAQPMLLHDSASNQLVETAILSTDFSKSAVLQRALQQPPPPPRRRDHSTSRERWQRDRSPSREHRQRDRSPSRERDRSPPRRPAYRDRSREQRREYRRRSPSPDSRRRSPPRSRRNRSPPPPRDSYHGPIRYSPPRDSARGSFQGRRQERQQGRRREEPELSLEDTWGAASPQCEGESGYAPFMTPAEPSTEPAEQGDASGPTSRGE